MRRTRSPRRNDDASSIHSSTARSSAPASSTSSTAATESDQSVPSQVPANVNTNVNTNTNTSAAPVGHRREKRRFFRRARAEERACNHSESASSNDSDDPSDDTIGSLPRHRLESSISHSTHQDPTQSPTSSVISADRILPAVIPGAVYTRGRAFGDFPEWARRELVSGLTPASRRGGQVGDIRSNSTVSSPVVPRPMSPSDRSRDGSLGSRSQSGSLTTGSIGRCPPRRNYVLGSVRNLLSSLRASSSLPEAEILDSEKVVYAEVVQNPGGGPVCSWDLLFYSVVLLLIGILIGRSTVGPPKMSTEEF